MPTTWKQWVGKLWPWFTAAVTALLEGVFGLHITWVPTAIAVLTGLIQFIISVIPDKE